MNLKRDTFKVFKCLYKTSDEFDELCWKILTWLYYDKFKDLIKNDRDAKLKHLKIFEDIIRWLDIYYSGSNPDFVSKYVLLKLEGKFIDN